MGYFMHKPYIDKKMFKVFEILKGKRHKGKSDKDVKIQLSNKTLK